MINFNLPKLVFLLSSLSEERRQLATKMTNRDLFAVAAAQPGANPEALKAIKNLPEELVQVTQSELVRISATVDYAKHVLIPLGMQASTDRLERFGIFLLRPYTGRGPKIEDLKSQVDTLYEAIESDCKFLRFYLYPQDKSQLLLRVQGDWGATLQAFPSIHTSVEAAADLYALGHNDACVFECMQVLESGLRVMATDVGETFDVQQWENIIGAIEGRITSMQKNGIPGMDKRQKDDRLQFLSEAAKEFRYFKDGWRNYVSHGRGNYDEHQAKGVLEHVRAFMNHLALRLKE